MGSPSRFEKHKIGCARNDKHIISGCCSSNDSGSFGTIIVFVLQPQGVIQYPDGGVVLI